MLKIPKFCNNRPLSVQFSININPLFIIIRVLTVTTVDIVYWFFVRKHLYHHAISRSLLPAYNIIGCFVNVALHGKKVVALHRTNKQRWPGIYSKTATTPPHPTSINSIQYISTTTTTTADQDQDINIAYDYYCQKVRSRFL